MLEPIFPRSNRIETAATLVWPYTKAQATKTAPTKPPRIFRPFDTLLLQKARYGRVVVLRLRRIAGSHGKTNLHSRRGRRVQFACYVREEENFSRRKLESAGDGAIARVLCFRTCRRVEVTFQESRG